MLKFFIQFILMFLFWKSNANQKGTWLTSSSFLIGIYVLSSFCGIGTLYAKEYTEPYESKYWFYMIEFLVFILISIYPFKYFKETKIDVIRLPSLVVLNVFSSILIILSFLSLYYYSSTLINIFSMGNLLGARNALYAGEEYVESGIFNTIASVSASMYVFVLLMFFVYTVIGGHRKRRVLLLLSSLSEPIHILCYVGRDGVVFWIFTFIFLFLLFSYYMEEGSIKSVRKVFIYGSVVLLFPFIMISVSRFENSDIGTGNSLISYMGTSFVNGPLFFGIDDDLKPYSDGRAFPLFLSLLGMSAPTGERELYQIGDWISWDFGTFLVAWYRNLHFSGLIILCTVLFLFFISVFSKTKNTLKFHKIFIYLLYFQVYGEGVFYFKHSGPGGNLFVILCLLFSAMFYFIENSNCPIYLTKKHMDIKHIILRK